MSTYVSNSDQGQLSADDNRLSSDEVDVLFDPELGQDEDFSNWTDLEMVVSQAYTDEGVIQQPVDELHSTPASGSSPASVFDRFSTPSNAAIYSGATTPESSLIASGVRIDKKSEAIAIAHPLAPGCTNGAYYGNKFHEQYCESRHCTASVHDKFAGTAHYAHFFGGVDPAVEFSTSVCDKVATSGGVLSASENATIENAVTQTLTHETVVKVLSAQTAESTLPSQPDSTLTLPSKVLSQNAPVSAKQVAPISHQRMVGGLTMPSKIPQESFPIAQPTTGLKMPTKVLQNAGVFAQQVADVAPEAQSANFVNSAPQVGNRSDRAQGILSKPAVRYDYPPACPYTTAEIDAAGFPQLDTRTSGGKFQPRAAANSTTAYSSPYASSQDQVAGGQKINNDVSAAQQMNPGQNAATTLPIINTPYTQQMPQNNSLNISQDQHVQQPSHDAQGQQLFQYLQQNPALYAQIMQQMNSSNAQQHQLPQQKQQTVPMNLQQVQYTQQLQPDPQMQQVQRGQAIQQTRQVHQMQQNPSADAPQQMQNTYRRSAQVPGHQSAVKFNTNSVQQNFNAQASINRPHTRPNAPVAIQTPTPVQRRAMSQGQAAGSQPINRAPANQQAFAPQRASSLQNASVPLHDLYNPLRSRAGRSINDTTPLSDQEVGYKLKYGGLGKPLIRVPLDFPDDADPTPYARPEPQNALGIQVNGGSAQPRGRNHQRNASSASISQTGRGTTPQNSASASRTPAKRPTPGGDPRLVALGPAHPMVQPVTYNHFVPRVATRDDSEDEDGNDPFFDLYSNKAVPLVEEPELPVAGPRRRGAPAQAPARAVARPPLHTPAQHRASLQASVYAPVRAPVYAPLQAPAQGSAPVYSQGVGQLPMPSAPSGPSRKRGHSEDANNEVQVRKRQFTPQQQQLANIAEEQDEEDLIMLSAPPTDQSTFNHARHTQSFQQAPSRPQLYSQILQQQQSFQQAPQQQQIIQQTPQPDQSFRQSASQAQAFSRAPQQESFFQQASSQTHFFAQVPQQHQSFEEAPQQMESFLQAPEQERSVQQNPSQLQFSGQVSEQQQSPQKSQSFIQACEQEQSFQQTPEQTQTYNSAPQAQASNQVSQQDQSSNQVVRGSRGPFAEITDPDDLDPFMAEWLQDYIDGKFHGQGFGN